jgi:hypothetical protein
LSIEWYLEIVSEELDLRTDTDKECSILQLLTLVNITWPIELSKPY